MADRGSSIRSSRPISRPHSIMAMARPISCGRMAASSPCGWWTVAASSAASVWATCRPGSHS